MIGEVTFGVIGLLFLFADVRTFTSTFQQTFFGAPNTNLAIMATSVFAASFLALVVAWRMSPRRAVATSAVLLALGTFLATASRNNWVDLALTVVALAGGFWWLALFHSARPGDGASPLARALPIALVSDLALRAAFRTVAVPDLAWPVATGLVLVAVLVFGAAGLGSLGGERRWTGVGARGFVALLAVPPLVLVAETGAANGAQAALAGGIGLGPEPARATQIGELVLGLGFAAGAIALSRAAPRGLVAAGAVAVGAALLWAHVPILSTAGAGVLAVGTLLAAAALFGVPLRLASSPASVVVALSLGWLLFVGTAFGFYAFWAYEPAVWAATAIVVLAAFAVPLGAVALGRALSMGVATLGLAVPLAAVLTVASPVVETPRPTVRVMTYNIHQGFNAGQIPSLEELARVIALERPDVVCLQEVVRGWMIDERQDALSVLAERLGMSYTWGPNIGDLYGNAILSRFAMTDVRRVTFAAVPGPRHQPRGIVFARTAGLLVGCTHLDDVTDASEVRQGQVDTILGAWDKASPAVIAGDLNAEPGAPEVRRLGAAGFTDLGAPAGETTTGENPQRRIDYIWGYGVTGDQARIPALNDIDRLKQASDHRPLVVNVTVAAGGR